MVGVLIEIGMTVLMFVSVFVGVALFDKWYDNL